MTAVLTMGPLLYHWPAETWRDFYFRVADEVPVASVYLGEIVCPKRAPFTFPHYGEVVERLRAAGKEIVHSTPILIVDQKDLALLNEAIELDDALIEANDVAALALLSDKPHAIGPYINVYNESTLAWLASRGATRVTLPVELPAPSIARLVQGQSVEIEVQVFGRWPLAISARCYHARAYGRTKESCLFACGEDPDGLQVDTLDGEPFLAVNGVQTLSATYGCLLSELDMLKTCGVRRFRLSPQQVDMVAVARVFRDRLEERIDNEEAVTAMHALTREVPLSNGFIYDREGASSN